MTRAALVLTLCLSGSAIAAPRLSADGDSLTVSADHAVWSGVAPDSRGDTIVVPLKSASAEHITLDDKVVKRIDVIAGDDPRLVLRLHHSKLTTQRTAALTSIQATSDGGIRVTFPRDAGHGVAQETLTEAPKPEAQTVAKVETKTEQKIEAPAVAPVATQPIVAQQPAPKPLVLAEEPSHGAGRIWSTMLLLVLGGIGVVYAIMKKRQPASAADEPFRVVATRTLGQKSKLFMVEVEDKKMLFAVDEKGTRLVDTWVKPKAPEQMPMALTAEAQDDSMTERFDRFDEDDAPYEGHSPAIQGLLELREKHGLEKSPIDDVAAEHDWAQMLIEATRRRGQS